LYEKLREEYNLPSKVAEDFVIDGDEEGYQGHYNRLKEDVNIP
jgi:hypothetical protein